MAKTITLGHDFAEMVLNLDEQEKKFIKDVRDAYLASLKEYERYSGFSKFEPPNEPHEIRGSSWILRYINNKGE